MREVRTTRSGRAPLDAEAPQRGARRLAYWISVPALPRGLASDGYTCHVCGDIMPRIIALDIMKALPQHAQNIGSSGISMMVAIASQWDSLGCKVAVCWSNSRLGERSGLSRNSVPEVRQRLIDTGWLAYLPDGRNSGHYTPKLPEFHAQKLSLIHISEPTRPCGTSRMPSSA